MIAKLVPIFIMFFTSFSLFALHEEQELVIGEWVQFQFTTNQPKLAIKDFIQKYHINFVANLNENECVLIRKKVLMLSSECLTEEDYQHAMNSNTFFLNTKFQKELYRTLFKIKYANDPLLTHPDLVKLLENLKLYDYFFKDNDLIIPPTSLDLWAEMTFRYLSDPLLYTKNLAAFKLLKESFFSDQVFFDTIPKNFSITKYEFLNKKFFEILNYCELKNKNPSIEILIASQGDGYGAAGHSFLKIKDCDMNSLNDQVFSFAAVTDPRMAKLNGIVKAFFGFLPLTLSEKQFYEILKIYTVDEQRELKSLELKLELSETKKLMELLLFRFKSLKEHSQNYSLMNKNCTTEIKKLIEMVLSRNLKSSLLGSRMPTKFLNYLEKNELLDLSTEKIYFAN